MNTRQSRRTRDSESGYYTSGPSFDLFHPITFTRAALHSDRDNKRADKVHEPCPRFLSLRQNAANINTDGNNIIKNVPSTIKCALYLRALHKFS